jgi:hypothetical protein
LKEKMQIPYIFLSRKLNERKKALNYSQSKWIENPELDWNV